jgi:hypothetical protein
MTFEQSMASPRSNHLTPLETAARAAPAPLAYGRPSGARRKRFARVAIILSLVVVATAAVKLIPPAIRNYQLLALQTACVSHSQPPDFVAFDTDPTAAAKKIAAGTHERVFSHSVHGGVPADLPSPAGYVFKPWRGLYDAIGPGNSRPSDATLFVGTLTSPAGHKRLVCIDLSLIQHMDDKGRPEMKSIYFRWAVIRPGSLNQPPVLAASFSDQYARGLTTNIFQAPLGTTAVFILDSINDQRRRFLAWSGEIDPADASHVTIRTENWECKTLARVNAYLGDDDRVTIKYVPEYYDKHREP